MSKHQSKQHCNNCNKETLHDIETQDHERDSSFDTETCTVCKYYKTGMNDTLHAPIIASEFYRTAVKIY